MHEKVLNSTIVCISHLSPLFSICTRHFLYVAIFFANISLLSSSVLPDGTITAESDEKIIAAQTELFECYQNEHEAAHKNGEDIRSIQIRAA